MSATDGLARHLAERITADLGARAVVLGGSRATGLADGASDLDLYVYADRIPPIEDRAALARHFGTAPGAEIGNTFFEPGDEWRHAATGTEIDIMYRTSDWIHDRIDAVLVRHEAQLGYTTCLWHNVRMSRPLADPMGWFADLQRRAEIAYPDDLIRAIVDLNWTMLAKTKTSWSAQLSAALDRGDRISAGHRATVFLASAFDILFAVNRRTHPGEKRLLAAAASCPLCPPDFAADAAALLDTAGRCDPSARDPTARLLAGLAPLVAPYRA